MHLWYCKHHYADRKIHCLAQAKRKRMHMGDLKIVVAGCVAQQEGATLLRRVPEVDLVMGPQYANRWGHYKSALLASPGVLSACTWRRLMTCKLIHRLTPLIKEGQALAQH